MTKSVRRYTAEFKQEAIRLALKSPSAEKTAKELGIPPGTLYSWIYALKQKSDASPVEMKSTKDISVLIDENRRLHKELAIAREEREILKKAAAYFAQHQK